MEISDHVNASLARDAHLIGDDIVTRKELFVDLGEFAIQNPAPQFQMTAKFGKLWVFREPQVQL
jgi:hypothetical protein